MRESHVAIFFILIFSVFIITPTIVKMVEMQTELSYFYSLAEEENSTKSNSGKSAEPIFTIHNLFYKSSLLKIEELPQDYYYLFNEYGFSYRNSNFRPPEA